MDFVDWSNEVTWRWRLEGEQQDTLSEKSYIRPVEFLPFLPASFVILWGEFALFFSLSALTLLDLRTDKGLGVWRGGLRGQHVFTVCCAPLKHRFKDYHKEKKQRGGMSNNNVNSLNVQKWWMWIVKVISPSGAFGAPWVCLLAEENFYLQ